MKIKGDLIPEAAAKEIIGGLQALFARHNAGAALSAKAVTIFPAGALWRLDSPEIRWGRSEVPAEYSGKVEGVFVSGQSGDFLDAYPRSGYTQSLSRGMGTEVPSRRLASTCPGSIPARRPASVRGAG